MSAKFREMYGSFIELTLQRWDLLFLNSMSKSTLKYIIKLSEMMPQNSTLNWLMDTYRKVECALNASYSV